MECLEDNMFAGACSTVLVDLILHPIDTINTRAKIVTSQKTSFRHTLKAISKSDGLPKGLYVGLNATIFASIIGGGLFFGTYESTKYMLETNIADNRLLPLCHLFAGGFSEAVSAIFIGPIHLIRAQQQLGCNPYIASGGRVSSKTNHRGLFHGLSSIYRKNGGVSGLYRGWWSYLSLDIANSALNFCFYEQLKLAAADYRIRHLQSGLAEDHYSYSDSSILSFTDILICGTLAGIGSAFLTNPIDVAVTRIFVCGKQSPYNNSIEGLYYISRRHGFRGLFQGATARVLSIAPGSGLQLMGYEILKTVFRRNGKVDN